MTPNDRNDRLLHLDLDGRLGRAGSAAVRVAYPDQQTHQHPLRRADAALRLHLPRRDGADAAAVALRQRICEALPRAAPRRSLRLRPRDLLLGVATIAAIAIAAALVTITPSGLSGSATFLVWTVGLCCGCGALLLLAPALLRRVEASVLSRVLHRPMVIIRGEVLIYRAVGAALLVAAWWLGH